MNSMKSEPKPDFLDKIQKDAELARQGLNQASLTYADAYIARTAENLEINVESLATTLALLNDPRTPLALAQIRAADLVDQRLGKHPEPMMAILTYAKAKIAVPSLPSFSQFYPSVSSEQQSALPGSQVHAEQESTTANLSD